MSEPENASTPSSPGPSGSSETQVDDAAAAAYEQTAAPPDEVPVETPKRKKGAKKESQVYPTLFAGCEPPKQLWQNRRIGNEIYKSRNGEEHKGTLHLAGRGSMTPQVLFIANCVLVDEARANWNSKPQMLNGPAGNLFLRTLSRLGFQDSEWRYTALVKYSVPKLKIKGPDIRWGEAVLEDEISTLKPKIIVCLGKDTFDFLWSKSEGKARKFALRDVQGGFFPSERYGALLYPMDTVLTPLLKPEYLERFTVDLRQVRQSLDELQGLTTRIRVEQKYVVIENIETLANVTLPLAANPPPLMAVDCEWHGQTAYGGDLRSFQFSWKPGHAAYLKLMNEKQQYCFSHPLPVVQNVLKPLFHNETMGFVGHNGSADMPWMHRRLGIPVYKRFKFDTMYAQHTINEYADLKLERCAVKYTDLGRYDIPLALWKKDNKFDDENEPGYGRVPDRIIIPYACLRQESLVQLGDGSWEPIAKLVRTKYSGLVRAFYAGQVVNRKVIGWHRTEARQQEWYRIETKSSKYGRWGLRGPVFTPDHKILTDRGRIEVRDLRPGYDSVLTDEQQFSADQLSVWLGSLLGDGGITRKNRNGTGFRFSQRPVVGAYADWKASVFTAFSPVRREMATGYHSYELPFSRQLCCLRRCFPPRPGHSDGKALITETLLAHLGDLGLAVWYQDDGSLVVDKRSRHKNSRIYCQLTDSEIPQVVKWLSARFGSGVTYNRRNQFIQISREAFVNFHAAITPYVHPCMGYKVPQAPTKIPSVDQNTSMFFDPVLAVVAAPQPRSRRGGGVRYCLTVEQAENFLTEVGFVSNCRDVDATIRCVPFMMKQLIHQGLLTYYTQFLLPFVTDGFYEMMDAGLPINEAYLDEMRDVFTRNQALLLEQFRRSVQEEAVRKFHTALMTIDGIDKQSANNLFLDFMNEVSAATDGYKKPLDFQDPGVVQMIDDMKAFVGAKHLDFIFPFMMHFLESGQFNINSTDQMRRWLFDIKGLKPLKTTKKDGIQMSWDKVLQQPADKQKEYQPAADKQTVKVYADKDQLVAQLQELKAVGNIVKAFLKGPDEEGREQGIPKWLQPDGRIHANFALTETARPRAWKPNILNWPKAVTKPIEAAFARIQKAYPEHAEKPNTLRSVVEAPPGWVIVDMDLKTAEVVALAYQSGDQNMINVLTAPDTQFARIDKENPKKTVRLCYNEISCYPESEWDPALIVAPDDPRILRTGEGQIIHPKRDLHWEMGEGVALKPREKCDERMHRDGCGKVGNFSIPYGASATLLERMIEVNTGKKPEEGTGQRMIETFENRYPNAAMFQKELEARVQDPGYWRSLSGRMRHFFYAELSDIEGIWDRDRQNLLSPLVRQARNFPCQELVAATTGKALLMFIEKRREMGLDSRIGLLLYDAMTAFAPLEQAKATAELLKNCLTKWNTWTVKGRTFSFEVDVSFYFRWGAKLSKEEKERLAPYI